MALLHSVAENDKTETNTARPAYLDQYTASSELGSDKTSSVISIEGALYQFPAPVSEFINNGWQIIQQPGAIVAGGNDSIRVEKDGKKLYLYTINFAEYQTTSENCVVYSVYIDADDEISVELPIGINFNSDKSDVEAAITEDFSCYEGTYKYDYSYSEYTTREYSLSIDVDVETEMVTQISMRCRTWDY